MIFIWLPNTLAPCLLPSSSTITHLFSLPILLVVFHFPIIITTNAVVFMSMVIPFQIPNWESWNYVLLFLQLLTWMFLSPNLLLRYWVMHVIIGSLHVKFVFAGYSTGSLELYYWLCLWCLVLRTNHLLPVIQRFGNIFLATSGL